MTNLPATLAFTGVLLFLLGLATGFAIPAMRAPRLGLSAHLASTQSGIALIAFAFLWPKLSFWHGWSAPLAHTIWVSFYVLWIGLVLAGAWGTGRSLPIAGAGYTAQPWQERTAITLIGVASLAVFAAIALVLIQWNWTG